ncbi:MAG: inorganic phosphate transporter [Candidatus Lokiarchaeota archaeon]|nr:inorganic phosphate transporter [Candidatus Lokiarchaeota archaeon]
MALEYIVIIFVIISIIISFGIGANDETMATLYGSKTLKMRELLILATIFAILGAVLLGSAVSETVGKDLFAPSIVVEEAIVLTVLISTAIWLIVSSAFGLPISTTHATIGAIIGVGFILGGAFGVNWPTILEMGMWWILSPIIGYIVTYYAYKLIHKTITPKLTGLKSYERSEKMFSYILLAVICWTAFSRAGNDSSNAVGIVVGVGIGINLNILLIITGMSLASGLVILGRGVIKNVGTLTELRPSTAFASQIPIAVILFFGTLLGIPLSGSHMLVASLIGLAKARRAPTRKGLWKIMAIWLLTFPMAAILSILLYFPINLLI